MDLQTRLQGMRSAKFVGVAALADEAERLLRATGGIAQERGTVSEIPDERTVRFYLGEGLIEPSEERQGSASVYGYRHLLQLLVVKKLQAEHLAIKKIRELVTGLNDSELESLLSEGHSGPLSRGDPMNYLQSLLVNPAPRSEVHFDAQIMRSIAPPMMSGMADPLFLPDVTTQWERIEIADGLELHVRDGYKVPVAGRDHKRLVAWVLNALQSYGKKPGKKEEK